MTDAQSTISFADKMKAAKVKKAEANRAAMDAETKAYTAKVGPIKAKGVASVKKSKEIVAKVSAARAKANGKIEARRALAPAKKVSRAEAQKAADAFVKAAVKKANKPVAQPTVEGPHGPPTIARSYKREFRGNGATLRGKMLQVTVTFTSAQFDVLKERADLYGASLSETIRKCVISGPLSVPSI